VNVTSETLDLIKKAQLQPQGLDSLRKAFTQATGLVWYDLEPAAKHLYPVLTPLRNKIPRVPGDGGTAVHWKVITAINPNNVGIGVSEGNRGGVNSITLLDKLATYAGIGLEDYVTFESEYAAKNFDSARATAVEALLNSLMIGEEFAILGGNTNLALGTAPTPTLATATTGGSLPASTTISVICVALTMEGLMRSSVSGGVPGLISKTNADGSVDTFGGGSSRPSTNATIATGSGGSTNSISAYVAPVTGAVAYAWFWGAAGSETLGAITTINSVVIKANATGTQLASSLTSDNSKNGLIFDGLLSVAAQSGYWVTQPTGTAGTGTPLTASGSSSVAEVDADLKYFWDQFRLSPTEILVSSQELMNIKNKVMGGSSGTSIVRFTGDMEGGKAVAGSIVLYEAWRQREQQTSG